MTQSVDVFVKGPPPIDGQDSDVSFDFEQADKADQLIRQKQEADIMQRE